MRLRYGRWTCSGSYKYRTWGVTESSSKTEPLRWCAVSPPKSSGSPAVTHMTHTHTNTGRHTHANSKAWIRTLEWPRASPTNYNWAHKEVSYKTCSYWIHSFGGYIREESKRERERGRERVCVFRGETFKQQVKSPDTNRIHYHQPLAGVFLALKLPWLTLLWFLSVFVDWVSAMFSTLHVSTVD